MPTHRKRTTPGAAARRRKAASLPTDRPLVTVDVAILTVIDDQLHVLLVRRPDDAGDPFPGRWALPGGFVDVSKDATLEACARRKLEEKTGVRYPYLEQVCAEGSRTRDPRGWSVTQVYVALVARSELPETLTAGGNAPEANWFPVDASGVGVPLAFDHRHLLRAALERVRAKSEYTALPAYLVPEPFTLPELQRIFEIVLGRPLEKKAFRTRVESTGMLSEEAAMRKTARRPARLYRLADRDALQYFRRAVESGR